MTSYMQLTTNCCGNDPMECSCDPPEPLGLPTYNYQPSPTVKPNAKGWTEPIVLNRSGRQPVCGRLGLPIYNYEKSPTAK